MAQQFDSFVVTPDMHINGANDDRNKGWAAAFAWLEATKTARRRKLIISAGDVTYEGSYTFWDEAVSIIGQTSLPVMLTEGNHDSPFGVLETYFPASAASSWLTCQAGIGRPNCYTLIELSGVQFLVIAIRWAPSDADIAWSASVCDAHPNTPTIFVTHAFQRYDGTMFDIATYPAQGYNPHLAGYAAILDGRVPNDGAEIWTKLISTRPSIKLVLCGHDIGALSYGAVPHTRADGSKCYSVLFGHSGQLNGFTDWTSSLREVFVDSVRREFLFSTFAPWQGCASSTLVNNFVVPF
jgi:hypothetical protein